MRTVSALQSERRPLNHRLYRANLSALSQMDAPRARSPLPSERKPSAVTKASHGFIRFILGSVGAVILGVFLFKLGVGKPPNPYDRPIDASTGRPIEGDAMALLIRRETQFPMEIDEATVITDITGTGDTLRYHYRLSEVEITDPDLVKSSVSRGYCESSHLSEFFDWGFIIAASYSDEYDRHILSFSTSSADCDRIVGAV